MPGVHAGHAADQARAPGGSHLPKGAAAGVFGVAGTALRARDPCVRPALRRTGIDFASSRLPAGSKPIARPKAAMGSVS